MLSHHAHLPATSPCTFAGSTVGAGMLALPAVSAPAGIAPTSAALVGIWVLLTLDALLIAEVNLAARTARDAAAAAADDGSGGAAPAGGDVVTLRQMAEFSLGKAAGRGLTLVYLALAYSLLTAYATKAAEVRYIRAILAGQRYAALWAALSYACAWSPASACRSSACHNSQPKRTCGQPSLATQVAPMHPAAHRPSPKQVLDYLAGGGLPPLLPAAAFVGGIGSLLYLGGTRTIDAINQVCGL